MFDYMNLVRDRNMPPTSRLEQQQDSGAICLEQTRAQEA